VGKRNTFIYVVLVFAVFVMFVLKPTGNILAEVGLKFWYFLFVTL
jgi:hypothetical protein